MKILIIEDDTGLCRGISFALQQEGYETITSRTIGQGYKLFETEHPDAVLLDLNLPDGDGIDCCIKIRQKSEVPVLMLTARDMETDELMGLTSGADDYMVKPFSVSVLKIRLQKLLERKAKSAADGKQLSSGDIYLDGNTFRAFRGGQELELSVTELRLLQYFLENQNQVLLKERILQHIWDADENYVEENTLTVNISRLRRKLGGNYIRTISGMGYLWENKECV